MSIKNIPFGWREATLGEISDFSYGSMPKKEKLGQGKFSTFSGYRYQFLYPECNCPKGTLIVVARGVGGTGDIKIAREDCYLTNLSIKFSINPNKAIEKFLYYNYSINNLRHLDSGSAQSQITIGDLQRQTIFLPPIPEQRTIAEMLSSFDAKIELLREQNRTLELTAQTIFQEWFGRYRVDDELPEGWKSGKFSDVVDIRGGTTPSTQNIEYWNGDIPWTSPKDLSNAKEIFLLQTEKRISKEGLKQIGSGLLPICTLLLSSRAPIGYLAITDLELAINQGYIAFLPNQYFSNYFMYLWLKTNMQEVINASNGSTFLEISKSSFRKLDCVIPTSVVLSQFDNVVEPIFQKILANIHQIKLLMKTRDNLLPKLLSGEVRVI